MTFTKVCRAGLVEVVASEVVSTDLVLMKDVDDPHLAKYATAQAIADLGGGGSSRVFFAASTTSTAAIANNPSWTDLPWNTELKKDSGFTHSSDSTEITFDAAGDYVIKVDCTADLAGTTRRMSGWRLSVNTGGGHAPLSDSYAYGYHRTSGVDRNTVPITYYYTASAGDIIKVQATSTGNTLNFVSGTSRIVIEKVA